MIGPELRIVHGLTDDVALAGNRADDSGLAVTNARSRITLLARFLRPVPVTILAANVSLVDFHDAHQFLELVVIHRSADACAHIPDGLVAGLVVEDHPLDLQ